MELDFWEHSASLSAPFEGVIIPRVRVEAGYGLFQHCPNDFEVLPGGLSCARIQIDIRGRIP